HQIYLRHGVTLPENACVFDVGANIGFFTLMVAQQCPGARIFAFEPLPPICEVLRRNVELYGIGATVLQSGLADEAKIDTFTFFPHVSVISGRLASGAEHEVVSSFLRNRQASDTEGVALTTAEIDELLAQRLTSERFSCPLRTVSEVIREH